MKAARLIVVVCGLALVLELSFWGGKHLFVRALAQAEVNVQPYVAKFVEYHMVGGAEENLAEGVESRRSDGAVHTRTLHYATANRRENTFRRVDFPNGVVAMIVDAVEAKSTGLLPPEMLASRKAQLVGQSASCAPPPEAVERTEILFGQTAFRVVISVPSDKLQRTVQWRLRDFNCVAVQTVKQSQASPGEPWTTTIGKRLVAFSATDPDPSLFTDWKDYAEMKPSDIQRHIYEQRGVTPQQCPRCFADDPSDGTYLIWHQLLIKAGY